MALYGIVADIHGNREALVAALAALDRHGPERLLCLGDIVGYNADPDECAAILEERGAISIVGNHDLIGIGDLSMSRCSNRAMHALKRTRRCLTPSTQQYLRKLPRVLLIENQAVVVHGGVRDVQQYMTEPHHIDENVHYLRADFPGRQICFYGHVHEQRIFQVEMSGRISELATNTSVKLRAECEYFVNPGSVDGSRKRAPRFAEYMVFDSEAMVVEFFRVPYDDSFTEVKAITSGYRLSPWRDLLYTLQRKIPGFR